jgi:hypothetical protein
MEPPHLARSSEIPSPILPSRRLARAIGAILRAGLTVGVLDALFAMVLYRTSAVAVFHSIASGLVGRGAYSGGLATAALGALLHFFIATTWAAVFVGASLVVPALARHAAPAGMAFGVVVYFFMNYVVLPLSAVSFARPFHRALLGDGIWLIGLLGHMVLIGLTIALFTRRAALHA